MDLWDRKIQLNFNIRQVCTHWLEIFLKGNINNVIIYSQTFRQLELCEAINSEVGYRCNLVIHIYR